MCIITVVGESAISMIHLIKGKLRTLIQGIFKNTGAAKVYRKILPLRIKP